MMNLRAALTEHLALPAGPYDIILADPPWHFRVWNEASGSRRSADAHYTTMEIADLMRIPVGRLAAPNSVLLLWSVAPQLPAALSLLWAWGFTYKTIAFTWAKTTRYGKWHMGLGYYTRANAELCLLGTRGKPLPRLDRGVRSLIVASVREHSRKPDDQYERIERLFGADRRKIELFARPPHPAGWDVWGSEAVDGKTTAVPGPS